MVGHLGTPEIGAGIDFSVRKLLLPRAASRFVPNRRQHVESTGSELPEKVRRNQTLRHVRWLDSIRLCRRPGICPGPYAGGSTTPFCDALTPVSSNARRASAQRGE